VFALTVTTTLWPALPVTVKLPESVPLEFIVAEPLTPAPLTVAEPVGTKLPQDHPEPLRLPLTEGALPEAGFSTRLAAAACSAVAGQTTRAIKSMAKALKARQVRIRPDLSSDMAQ
jgi:hypothetical protein